MDNLDQVKVHVLETMEEKERQDRIAIGEADIFALEVLLYRRGWTATEVSQHINQAKEG